MGNAYSFQDVSANIAGPPGFSINLGQGAASAKEGITIAPSSDQSTMVIGAGGAGQHNLHADKSGVITARFLKISPTNQLLMAMFDAQRLSASLTGQNIITVEEKQSGDITTATGCSFKKKPDIVYAEDGPMMEWTFNCILIDSILGQY